MSTKSRYITTTLPYVNARPHIGHALEVVQADALARYWRLMGDEVFFNTGTDEHGQKIYEEAIKAGKEPQTYVDEYAATFDALKMGLNLSNDAFIRTTDLRHIQAAQEMWKRCDAAGDIYKDTFEGLYCVGCERYLTERDLEDGKCPFHPDREPERVTEENYFFRFSKYAGKLTEYLKKEESVIPEVRRKEALQFVENGLTDFSISRRKERLHWGVPVPGDDEHVMYVWFDALANYISTLGWGGDDEKNFENFWVNGETLQMAGKDQVRFQSLMWQAMLISAGVPNTDHIFYHGFITSGGQKMSKSLGNVIDPMALVEKYGTDAVRYFLLRHVHPTEDSDMTEEKFVEAYNANLANGLGNLTARIMKMAEDNLDGPAEIPPPVVFAQEYTDTLERFAFNEALDCVWAQIGALDEKITTTEPFKLIKTNPNEAKQIIAELAQGLYIVGRMLYPFMPETNVAIKEAVKANKKPDTLFARI